MTTGLKAMGIIGTGAMLALGISASDPSSSSVTNTPSPIVAPNQLEAKTTTQVVPEAKVAEPIKKASPKPSVADTKTASSCHPNYSGCLKVNAGDYDCAKGKGNGPNYTGAVQVYGADPFDLDRDNDGLGCE